MIYVRLELDICVMQYKKIPPSATFLFTLCYIKYLPFFSTPCPAIVDPSEHFDDEDGLPEKLLQKTPKYYR